MRKAVQNKLSTYRYEFLLFALLLLIFDKIFFLESEFYLRFVWPFNMIIISIACYGITIDHNKILKVLRNIFGLLSILMPFGFMIFQQNTYFLQFLVIFFSLYYSFIFGEVMYQITLTKVVRINVIIGSFCGFMLLSMIALFTFLIIENYFPNSFHGISVGRFR
jgi:voltage-gated potassium channel